MELPTPSKNINDPWQKPSWKEEKYHWRIKMPEWSERETGHKQNWVKCADRKDLSTIVNLGIQQSAFFNYFNGSRSRTALHVWAVVPVARKVQSLHHYTCLLLWGVGGLQVSVGIDERLFSITLMWRTNPNYTWHLSQLSQHTCKNLTPCDTSVRALHPGPLGPESSEQAGITPLQNEVAIFPLLQSFSGHFC